MLELFTERLQGISTHHLMDIQMPKWMAIQLQKRSVAWNGKTHSIPIIALTANAFDEDGIRRLLRMNGSSAKPIDVGRMVRLIGRW